MVGISVLDRALQLVVVEIIIKSFLNSKNYSENRIKKIWQRRVRSRTKTLPSTLDKKNGGISRRIATISDLIFRLNPKKTGKFPNIGIPNGWQKERFEFLRVRVWQDLLDAVTKLERKLTRARSKIHNRSGKCHSPPHCSVIDNNTTSKLINIIQNDLHEFCRERNLAPTLEICRAWYNGALCLFRKIDPQFDQNSRIIYRSIIKKKKLNILEPLEEKFERKMRRIAILEDKLDRLGVNVRQHCDNIHSLFHIEIMPETLTMNPMGPIIGLKIGTYNPGTLKGGHKKEPVRAYEIIHSANDLRLNLIAVQESKLVGSEDIHDLPGKWRFIGINRPALKDSNRNPGGGVGWLINLPDNYQLSQIERPNKLRNSKIEISWIKILSKGGLFIFGCIYWPPGGTLTQWKDDVELIQSDIEALTPMGKISILGDFNSRIKTNGSSIECSRGRILRPLLEASGLTIRNYREPTHVLDKSKSIIDYIICDHRMCVKNISVEPLTTDNGHRLVSGIFSDILPMEKMNRRRLRINNTEMSNPEKVQIFQTEIEKRVQLQANDSLGVFSSFIINEGMKIFGKKKKQNSKAMTEMPPWWTAELSGLVAEKRMLLRLGVFDQIRKKEIQNISNRISRLCKIRNQEYWFSVCSKIGDEIRTGGKASRSAWRSLGTMIRPRKSVVLAEPNKESVTKLWSDLWSSKDNEDESLEFNLWNSDQNYFDNWRGDEHDEKLLAPVSGNEVREAGLLFSDNKAADIRGMVNEIFKILPHIANEKLALEFTRIIKGEKYPSEWTEALVVLIFKNGDPSLAANYRPITLLSAFFRLLEAVLLKRIKEWLKIKPFIDPNQLGFQPQRSCEELGVAVRLAIEQALFLKKSLYVGCFDFRKAFDLVSHSRLFKKIRDSPLPPPISRVICALIQRHTSILPNGAHVSIDCGVPQGSLLAPTAFLVFINDLPKFICEKLKNRQVCPYEKPILLFADDTNGLAYTLPAFEMILKGCEEWSKLNRLPFQISKTNIACFNKAIPTKKIKFGGETLEFKTDINIVGIPFSTKVENQSLGTPLKSRATIQRIKGLIHKGLDVRTSYLALQMYVSSTLLYGCPSHDLHSKAQIIQNDLVQPILGTYRCSSIARSHLVLNLVRVKTSAAIRRVTSALRFRSSPLGNLKELIDKALAEKWPWGKLIQKDLETFNIEGLWIEACNTLDLILDRTIFEKQYLNFKKKIKTQIIAIDSQKNREGIFDVATSSEIIPWRHFHPAIMAHPPRYGYMWLRNSFKPPHLLHGKLGIDVEDDCPACQLSGSFNPSHILQCDALGNKILPAEILNLESNRWNFRENEQITLSETLIQLKKRHLMCLHLKNQQQQVGVLSDE